MTKADRDALLRRVATGRLYSDERITDFCAREIYRAVRRERKRALPSTVTGRWLDQRWVPPVKGRRKEGYWLCTVQVRKGKRR
jgi:hypothetical protein